MSNPTFNARDLWQSQVPYYEPDQVEPVIVANVRTMIFAGFWRTASALAIAGFEWTTISSLSGASGLSADGSVV